MPNRISRRNFGLKAALGLTAVATLSEAKFQATPVAKPPEIPAGDLDHIEMQLASPLTAEAKKLLPGAVTNSSQSSQNRLKTKLPENSEPCFVTLTHPAEVNQP